MEKEITMSDCLSSKQKKQHNKSIQKRSKKQTSIHTDIRTSNLFRKLISRLSDIGRTGTQLNDFLKIVVRKTPPGWLSKILYWILLIIRQIRNILFQGSFFSNISSIIKEVKYRLLLFPQDFKKKLKGKNIIWINATGIGEWNLIEPLLKDFKKKYPTYIILLSCPHKQGFKHAQKRFIEENIIYTPFDILAVVNKFFSTFTVKLLIMAEIPGQIGLHFLKALKNSGGTSMIFNGRMPDESMIGIIEMICKKGYKGRTNREIFSNIDYLLMQDDVEAKKIIAQGADELQIHICGNVKYDTSLYTISFNEKKTLYQILRVKEETPILLAGSTHAGEHEIILNVFQELKKKYPALLLIIAPRNLIDVQLILNKVNPKFVCFRKTKLKDQINIHTLPDIIILDTLGELKKFYSISTISIICGSFLPSYTGHSPLEPANFAKPIIFGRYMQNLASMAKLFVMKKGAFQVNNQIELIKAIKQLLENVDLQKEYGKNAYNLLKKNRGSLKRSIKVFDCILKKGIKNDSKSCLCKMG